jgi:hypothetical protein
MPQGRKTPIEAIIRRRRMIRSGQDPNHARRFWAVFCGRAKRNAEVSRILMREASTLQAGQMDKMETEGPGLGAPGTRGVDS